MSIGCKDNQPMSEKVPGWYSCKTFYQTGDSLVGKMTYYKNGQSRMNATYYTKSGEALKLAIQFHIEGHWRVENGRLIDSVEHVYATPAKLRSKIENILNSSGTNSGSKIIQVDSKKLLVQDNRGVLTEFTRIEKKDD
jgi:hypothetical protein